MTCDFKNRAQGALFFLENYYLEDILLSKIVKIDELRPVITQILSLLKTKGFRLIRVKRLKGKSDTMQFMVEKINFTAMSLKDCEEVSRAISTILDNEDPIKNRYFLEVSSPGIERPLIELSDFRRYRGSFIKLKLKNPENKIIKIIGLLNRCDEENIEILENDTGNKLLYCFNDVLEAQVVLEDKVLCNNKI